MSQFLASIHTWLFNKVLILENIEKTIEKHYTDEEISTYHQELKEKIGDYLPELSLEAQIDPSNIHGWLQEKINKAETRQAAFVCKLLAKDEHANETIQSIYNQEGIALAKKLGVKMEDPSEIFEALNNVLLEGMPCDRANRVLEQTNESIIWETVHCVHKNNWESNGVEVSFYYGFRASLIQGFVNTVSEHCNYSLNDQKGQIHTIQKED